MPKISVIVPVYNVGQIVKRCLDSIINQSYKDIEIVIVNDGSTDDSEKFLELYLDDSKIKYIKNEKNLGLGYARNIGMFYSKGDYITYVDSDDWVDLDTYNTMINYALNTNSDIVICGVKNEYNNFISSSKRYSYSYSNELSKEEAIRLLSRSNDNNYMISPVVWNKIYKKELLLSNEIKFLNNSFWEDNVFSFQAFTKANRIGIVSNVHYHYFQRENSITNSFSKKHIDDLIEAFQILKIYLEQQGIYQNYQNEFCSYFDRAIISLLDMLFKCEPSINIQKKYIFYLFEQFSNNFSLKEAISYLDIDRIKKIFR